MLSKVKFPPCFFAESKAAEEGSFLDRNSLGLHMELAALLHVNLGMGGVLLFHWLNAAPILLFEIHIPFKQ